MTARGLVACWLTGGKTIQDEVEPSYTKTKIPHTGPTLHGTPPDRSPHQPLAVNSMQIEKNVSYLMLHIPPLVVLSRLENPLPAFFTFWFSAQFASVYYVNHVVRRMMSANIIDHCSICRPMSTGVVG